MIESFRQFIGKIKSLLLFYGKGVKDDLSKAEKDFIGESVKRTKDSLNSGK